MKLGQALRALLLAGAATYAALFANLAQAQPTQGYEIHKGDTLFAVARKSKHDGVTRNQMILAIYRANPGAFVDGNINRLEIGAVLAIPPRDEVERITLAEADRDVRELLAANPPASPGLAVVNPAPTGRPTPQIAPAAPGTAEAAAKRYQDGLGLESRGDHQGAFAAFLEAGEAGNGLAQRKLGQIYDKGNPAIPRDYQASLKWYQKAREQGVELDKPLPRMGPP